MVLNGDMMFDKGRFKCFTSYRYKISEIDINYMYDI